MISSKDILARLQNGETAEAIANELITALNDANEAYIAESSAKKCNYRKIKDMQDILDAVHDFCIEYYCDSNEDIDEVEKIFKEFTGEKAVNMIEETGAALLEFENRMKNIGKMFDLDPASSFDSNHSEVEVKINHSEVDAIIDEFLKSINLK